MSADTRHFGAKWWKFDFHTHTPRSDDYGKGPEQAALKTRSPRDWLFDYMTAGIDCVAVTDHNSGEWINPLKEELARLAAERPTGFRPLTIFPGVEVSVNGGVHILALFDPSVDGNKIIRLLTKCEFDGEAGKTDDCTKKSCPEVIEFIQEEGGIPIIAHGDQACGLFHVQTGVTLKQSLKAEGLLAMELVSPAYTLPTVYSDLKLSLASVLGSDSHHPNAVGTRYTWVKMETPSLDALRLALHDGEDGVRRSEQASSDPNEIGPRFYLRRLVVSKGQKVGNGRDLVIELSPWFNTFIGGRGSGKSSILDFLRIVLARTDGMPPEVKKEFEEFNRVPRSRGELGMLRPETSLRLELVKDRREIALVWKSGGGWAQEELDANGNWLAAGDIGAVSRRFPVRIFSQKQLYEMTKEPDVLLNLIDERWDKRKWIEKRRALVEQWLQNRREVRQTEQSIATVAQTHADLEDVKAKIKIFDEGGHKDVLTQYQAAQSTKQTLDAKQKELEFATVTVRQMREMLPEFELEAELKNALGPDSIGPLKTIVIAYESIRTRIAAIETELKELEQKWAVAIGTIQWKATLGAATKRYEELAAQLQRAGGADISGYPKLVEQRADLEGKAKRLEEHEAKLAQLRDAGTKLLREIEEHERLLRSERGTVIAKWKQPGNAERIRVTLQAMGNREGAEEELRDFLRKSGEEFANDIYRSVEGVAAFGFLAELERTDAPNRWAKLEAIRAILRDATYADPRGLDRRFARHLEQLRQQTPEDLA